MYKVLIVDDENIVRRGIKNSINWNEYEVEMVAEAQNGLEALDEVLSNLPDIILLDICMPGMNGLEFAKIIKKQYPHIKIVIITGFHDFEYARTALRTGIDDYILKPITKEDVQNIVKTQLNKIKEEKLHTRPVSSYVNEHTLKQNIINSWLKQGNITSKDMQTFCDMQRCNEQQEAMLVYIQKYLTGIEVWGDKDNLAEFAILNIADEILAMEDCGFAFTTHKNEMAMLIFADKEKTKDILYEISKNVLDFVDLNVYFAVSKSGTLQEAQELSKQAKEAADRFFALRDTDIAFFEDVFIKSNDDFNYPAKNESTILKKMFGINEQELADNVEEFFSSINSGTSKKIKNAILRLLIGISNTIDSVNSANLGEYKNFEPDEIAGSFVSCEDAKAWVLNYLKELSLSTNSLRTRSSQHFIKIKEYLQNNYSKSELNLKKCSEDLFLSSNYISMIIKKETNRTFVDYLNDMRIKNAELLLKNPKSKIYEVSEKVGFTHPTYFSMVFKKIIGLTPKQYSSGG